MDDLDKLRAVAEAATPGPWRHYNDGVVGFPVNDETGEGIGKGFRPAAGSDTDYDQRLLDAIHVATFDPPTVAALIDRVERAEREREEWKDRMWVSVRERAVWSHEAGQHAGDIPFHHCPICEASFHRSELAALRAAVEGLADEWAKGCDACRFNACHCSELRALLTEGADERPCAGVHCGDGRECPAGEGASEEDCQNAWADLNEQAHYE